MKPWLIAIRPKTLSMAVVPVLVGSILGWAQSGALIWQVMFAVLAVALLIQVGTNLHNDVADFEHGADDSTQRLGPARATAEGWLTANQVRRGAIISFLLAFFIGLYLVWKGGWPLLMVGLLSIAAGWAYTGGPKPIGYIGLGELFVFIFFGLVAVSGSYYLQTGHLSWSAFFAGAMIGMPAAAALVVNNYRDRNTDKLAGKNTLAVRLSPQASKIEYGLLMLIPFVLLPALYPDNIRISWLLAPFALIPWALILLWRFNKEAPGPGFNRLLAATAQFQLGLGITLCLALLGSRLTA